MCLLQASNPQPLAGDLVSILGYVLLIVLGLCVLAGVLFAIAGPVYLARKWNHPSANTIGLLVLLGMCFWPCLVAAWIWCLKRPEAAPKVAQTRTRLDHDTAAEALERMGH